MNLRRAIPSNALRFNQRRSVDSSSFCVCPFERTERNDSEGVDVLMRPEIMCLDVMPMTCISNPRQIKDAFNIGLKIWIVNDSSKIAFEMDNVDQIKTS